MRPYLRGMVTGGLVAAGVLMWMQGRRRRARFAYLSASSVARAAQGGRRWLQRIAR